MKHFAFAASLLCSLLVAPGSAIAEDEPNGGSALGAVGRYFVSRVLDLADIVKLNASVGPGVAADVRLTRLLAVGFSDYDVLRVGLNGRHLPIWREELDESAISVLGITSGKASRDFFEVGVTLNLLLVGGEVAVNVGSLADFFLGLFTLDIEDDDWRGDRR